MQGGCLWWGLQSLLSYIREKLKITFSSSCLYIESKIIFKSKVINTSSTQIVQGTSSLDCTPYVKSIVKKYQEARTDSTRSWVIRKVDQCLWHVDFTNKFCWEDIPHHHFNPWDSCFASWQMKAAHYNS